MEIKQLTSNPGQLRTLLTKLSNHNGITKSAFDLCDEKEYNTHANIVKKIGNELMAKEFRAFEIDEYNQKILRFLLLYFNQCKKAEEVFPEESYKIHKQIMLIGNVGVGKSMLMHLFSRYLHLTKNPGVFFNVSVTEMTNYYKVFNHLDKYTFNELASERRFNGNPVNLCLNDLGLKTHLHFGVDTKVLVDDFLYARYELYVDTHKMAHLTTNLSVAELKKTFDPRLADRFKSYNIIDLSGESRRK